MTGRVDHSEGPTDVLASGERATMGDDHDVPAEIAYEWWLGWAAVGVGLILFAGAAL